MNAPRNLSHTLRNLASLKKPARENDDIILLEEDAQTRMQVEEEEKRQYRKLMIFIGLLLILIAASVLFKPDLKEVAVKGKGNMEMAPGEPPPSEAGKKKAEGGLKGLDGKGLPGGKKNREDPAQAGGGGGGQGGSDDATPHAASGEGTAASQETKPLLEGAGEGPAKEEEKTLPPPPPSDGESTPLSPKVFLREVRIGKTSSNERRVFAELINDSGKPLKHVRVVINFLGHDEQVMHRRLVDALVVGGGLFGDRVEPLASGDWRKFSVNMEDLPPGWSGSVKAEIEAHE